MLRYAAGKYRRGYRRTTDQMGGQGASKITESGCTSTRSHCRKPETYQLLGREVSVERDARQDAGLEIDRF